MENKLYTLHAKQRAAERFGIIASHEQLVRAALDILDALAGEASTAVRLAAADPRGAERWAVQLNGQTVVAIYRPDAACITTIVPHRRDLGSRYVKSIQHHNGRLRKDRGARRWEEDDGE